MAENNEGKASGWTFKPEDSADKNAPPSSSKGKPIQPVSWTASEFIAHQKSPGWYLALLLTIVAVAGLALILTKDWVSSITILVVGILFAAIASKKPRQLSYQLNNEGITIGEKLYPYGMFKSFAVLRDGAIGCINLMPLKRFMPDLSIYYPPEEEENIVNALAASLPHDQREEHSFDRLMKKIRF